MEAALGTITNVFVCAAQVLRVTQQLSLTFKMLDIWVLLESHSTGEETEAQGR